MGTREACRRLFRESRGYPANVDKRLAVMAETTGLFRFIESCSTSGGMRRLLDLEYAPYVRGIPRACDTKDNYTWFHPCKPAKVDHFVAPPAVQLNPVRGQVWYFETNNQGMVVAGIA